MERLEQLYGGFTGTSVSGVEVNAVRVGQHPLCFEGRVSQMRTLQHMRSAVFAMMNPSLICGALATGKSGLVVPGVCSVDILEARNSKDGSTPHIQLPTVKYLTTANHVTL